MYRNVMLAYDGSACSRLALQEALQMTEQGAQLTIVMLTVGGPQALAPEQLRTELAAQLAGPTPETVLSLRPLSVASEQELVPALVDEMARCAAALLVVGLPASGGQPRSVLGRHAERLSREAPCPVLLVRTREPMFSCLNPAEIYGMWPEAGPKNRVG